jgi:hypothetical protein
VNMILKHWPILAAVVAGSIAYGGLENKVASHEEQLKSLGQMRVDIGVIKAWVERQEREERRILRK